MQVTVRHVEAEIRPTLDNVDFYAVFSFFNNSPRPMWGMYTAFHFGEDDASLLTCSSQTLEPELLPGEVRRRKFRFFTGDCRVKEADEAAQALRTGRSIPQVFLLPGDLEIPYSFLVSMWPSDPCPEVGAEPAEMTLVAGKIVIPRGTPSDFCIHHQVETVPIIDADED